MPSRIASWTLVACALSVASGAAAQGGDVLVRIDARDPVAEATSLELTQRGLRASYDDVPQAADAVGRAHESRVAALALGARAAVWLDTAADGRSVVVRALRAEDGEEGSSVVGVDDVRADPRLAALVAGALAEEMLARPFDVRAEPATALTPPAIAAADDTMPATTSAPQLRAYGTLSTGLWGRFDPVFGGGFDLRGSSGAEWPDGLRVGAHARFLSGSDSVVVDDQLVGRLASCLLVGAEVLGRFQVPGHALVVGASVAIGPAQRLDARGDPTWDVLVVAGGIVGFAFPVGSHGAEMGVHIGLDALFEPARGVAPSPSLALRWDWR